MQWLSSKRLINILPVMKWFSFSCWIDMAYWKVLFVWRCDACVCVCWCVHICRVHVLCWCAIRWADVVVRFVIAWWSCSLCGGVISSHRPAVCRRESAGVSWRLHTDDTADQRGTIQSQKHWITFLSHTHTHTHTLLMALFQDYLD